MTKQRCTNCYDTGARGVQICACQAGDSARKRIAHMRPDNRAKVEAVVADVTRELVDLVTERRILAALIVEPAVLRLADDLECGDFSDARFAHVLAAIRRLQATSADVGIDEIDHELQLEDMVRDRMGAGAIAPLAGFWFLANLLLEFAPYGSETALVEHDLAWLRELSTRRRALRWAA